MLIANGKRGSSAVRDREIQVKYNRRCQTLGNDACKMSGQNAREPEIGDRTLPASEMDKSEDATAFFKDEKHK